MYMPSLFNDNFFDDFITFPFERNQSRKPSTAIMRTDIKEMPNEYQIEMELPGFKREDISASLEDGYLTITASQSSSCDANNDTTQDHGQAQKQEGSAAEQTKGRYIRRERYYGTYARRFFVGKYLSQEDIKAKFENGILILNFPKEDQKKIAEAKYITIG